MHKITHQNAKESVTFLLGDELSDGICLVDSKGVILAVNNEYLRIFDEREEDILNNNIDVLVKKGHFKGQNIKSVLEGKQKINSLITIKSNANTAMMTSIPILNDKKCVDQVLIVVRDLTNIINMENELKKAEHTNKKYRKELEHIKSILRENDGFIGESERIKRIKETINTVAKTDATILITGETGSGKEVLAREIHKKSNRKNGPYIKINCAAIPESLIESELFGYEQGAFTGASNKKKLGMFELAEGGTILLDEIGEMPIALQSKLLRVLQEKELMRVGGTKSIKLNVRVIASTNENLQECVKNKTFREDLYYRLNVIPIKIPPIRQRKDDIALLAYNFLEKYNVKYNKNVVLDMKTINLFEQYDWPGNVRELQNAIERLVVINSNNKINYNFVNDILHTKEKEHNMDFENLSLKEAVQKVEKTIIAKALAREGSTYKAAKVLGLNQSSIFRKAKTYGLLP